MLWAFASADFASSCSAEKIAEDMEKNKKRNFKSRSRINRKRKKKQNQTKVPCVAAPWGATELEIEQHAASDQVIGTGLARLQIS